MMRALDRTGCIRVGGLNAIQDVPVGMVSGSKTGVS